MCLFFESHPSKSALFDASREKFISCSRSHTICQNFESVPRKTYVFDVSRKKFLHRSGSRFRVSDIYVSLYPFSVSDMSDFCVRRYKNCLFWVPAEIFLQKKDRQQCPSPFTRVSSRVSTYIYVVRSMPVPDQSSHLIPPYVPVLGFKL